ncbi:MAG: 16S rRNA (cytosine(967)-C(5))-methyltransferase RsmB [Bacillota bacterium]|nr:16S rRNA (cytosine(967)-C(5))-methyltransferase RsmB [Bacillota bacterium]
MESNARFTAYKVLLKIEEEQGYSSLSLNNAVKEDNLSPLDVAFATALVYGVLERKLTIDYILSKFIKLPKHKISTEVFTILRLGVFQIIFMDKIPVSAAVNECVNIAKSQKLFNATGFINGVLRSIARTNNAYTLPRKNNYPFYLSIKYSCPQDLIKLSLNHFGEEMTINILESFSDRPNLTARVNTLKTTSEQLIYDLNNIFVMAEKCDGIPDALNLKNTGSIESLETFQKGEFHIQDGASQLCAHALNPKAGMTVLDVCAAPGGKSFTIAELMSNQGEIYSFDLYQNKLNLISDESYRLGIKIIKTKKRNAQISQDQLPMADRILCDVPCSGLGVIRRKPEIRYKPDFGLRSLPNIQYEILCNSARFLKQGGIMVYSTCTWNPRENGEVANRFLAEHSDFAAQPLNLPEKFKSVLNEPENQLTLFPHVHGTDGFFISAFTKI